MRTTGLDIEQLAVLYRLDLKSRIPTFSLSNQDENQLFRNFKPAIIDVVDMMYFWIEDE